MADPTSKYGHIPRLEQKVMVNLAPAASNGSRLNRCTQGMIMVALVGLYRVLRKERGKKKGGGQCSLMRDNNDHHI